MKKVPLCLLLLFTLAPGMAQNTLLADGRSDAYELINAAFAPGYDVLEVPDCSHSEFGKHIDQVFDQNLNQYVFRFHAHHQHDNDACKDHTQQRNEIKIDLNSPKNLLANEKETVTYRWKFKLEADFIPSKKFSYLHQINALGGFEGEQALFALSAHKGSSDQLSILYQNGEISQVLYTDELEPLKGNWITATETITFGEIGAYTIELKRTDTDEVVFTFTDDSIRTWTNDAISMRPKWGIFRSIEAEDEIKDEIIAFTEFSIQKSNTLSEFRNTIDRGDIHIYPNPTSSKANIKGDLNEYDSVTLCDSFGKEIPHKTSLMAKTVDVSRLKNGIYFVVFKKENKISSVKKLLKF